MYIMNAAKKEEQQNALRKAFRIAGTDPSPTPTEEPFQFPEHLLGPAPGRKDKALAESAGGKDKGTADPEPTRAVARVILETPGGKERVVLHPSPDADGW